jgi:K+-transporting ATPase ATPase A chain
MMVLNVAGLIVVYAFQRLKGFLPRNPQSLSAILPDSSFNTAASFATNINQQGCGAAGFLTFS